MTTQIDRVLRSNLKLRHLQLLVALDQFRHLGRAAEFLSLTQPAVSKTLAEIERLFGLPLFDRSTRGTEPTPAGASVVRFARAVLADYERTRDEIAAVAAGAAGRVSVGAMVVATPGLLARAVGLVKQRSAHTVVLVEEGDLTRLLPRLRLGELDVFVGRLEPGYAAPDLETEALYDEPMAVVLPPGHALLAAGRTPVKAARVPKAAKPTWAALAALPWVLPPPWASLRTKLEQTFFRHGLQPPVDVVETASFLNQLTFVRTCGAAALMARSVAQQVQRDGLAAVLPLAVPMALPPVGLITLRGRRRTPAAELMIGSLREAAAAMATRAAAQASARRAE